jgi:hypothetical protein
VATESASLGDLFQKHIPYILFFFRDMSVRHERVFRILFFKSMRKDPFILPEVFNEEHNVTSSSSLQGSLLTRIALSSRRGTVCCVGCLNSYQKEGTGDAANQHWVLLEEVKD